MRFPSRSSLVIALCLGLMDSGLLQAAGTLTDLGVAVPASTGRGTVATRDGNGRDVLLTWLHDTRGCYGMLVTDALTGASTVVDLPFANTGRDSPFASILSSRNKYYSHFGHHFVEFDPATRSFTFVQKSSTTTAMSMTESDTGVIYAGTHPEGGLFSYDPGSHEYKDFGSLNAENWAQYPRTIATDSSGWVYLGIGITQAITLIVDPRSGRSSVAATEGTGVSLAVRYANGKVYAKNPNGKFLALFNGVLEATVDQIPSTAGKAVPYISGSQSLVYSKFPDGRVLKSIDIANRVAVTTLNGKDTSIHFNYPSQGADVVSVQALPNGHVVGGSTFPFKAFDYDLSGASPLVNHDAYLQWNTIGFSNNHVFVGGYVGGFLLDWDPFKPWVPTVPNNPLSNPLYLTDSNITDPLGHAYIERPSVLLIDGPLMVLGGGPNYGVTGGGLHFWKAATPVSDALDVMVDTQAEAGLTGQSTASLIALARDPLNRLLGGTTIAPGTGGATTACEAELYLMDKVTRKVTWHAAVIPGARLEHPLPNGCQISGVKSYQDLIQTENGTIFGMTDAGILFVFDLNAKRVSYQQDLSFSLGRPMAAQSPRDFVRARLPSSAPACQGRGSNGSCEMIYILFKNAIAQLDVASRQVRRLTTISAPDGIRTPGTFHAGKILFGSGSHLFSYEVPTALQNRNRILDRILPVILAKKLKPAPPP